MNGEPKNVLHDACRPIAWQQQTAMSEDRAVGIQSDLRCVAPRGRPQTVAAPQE